MCFSVKHSNKCNIESKQIGFSTLGAAIEQKATKFLNVLIQFPSGN